MRPNGLRVVLKRRRVRLTMENDSENDLEKIKMMGDEGVRDSFERMHQAYEKSIKLSKEGVRQVIQVSVQDFIIMYEHMTIWASLLKEHQDFVDALRGNLTVIANNAARILSKESPTVD
jgi:hypothetical protein